MRHAPYKPNFSATNQLNCSQDYQLYVCRLRNRTLHNQSADADDIFNQLLLKLFLVILFLNLFWYEQFSNEKREGGGCP